MSDQKSIFKEADAVKTERIRHVIIELMAILRVYIPEDISSDEMLNGLMIACALSAIDGGLDVIKFASFAALGYNNALWFIEHPPKKN